MAEAYALSLAQAKGFRAVSSSGIEASRSLNGDVDPVAIEALKADGIEKYLAPKWSQTTQEDINNHDVIVFMSQSLYDQAKRSFNIPEQKARVWNIRDIDGVYPQIKQEVDKLASEIKL